MRQLVTIFFIFMVVMVLLVFFLCLRGMQNMAAKHNSRSILLVSKEILVVKALDLTLTCDDVVDANLKTDQPKIKVEAMAPRMSGASDSGCGAHRGEEENVISERGYGVVYRGLLHDGSLVAVKNLLNNKKKDDGKLEMRKKKTTRLNTTVFSLVHKP
ncbi:hypothetical protein Fmac_015874 [Flemingia macrophylla]|uniref:non-specific serine/threonine protein kinase n=1 Tax=Flemingia macrophylla TaxID=520843 RepID=A0ABD1MFS6_9FABA